MNFLKLRYCWFVFCLMPAIIFAQNNRPNIIFILTDDQRWNALGMAGNNIIITPQMDALAKTGTYFKNAFSTTPICAASRASILTGLYERTHGYTFQKPKLQQPYAEIMYPKILKDNGYYVGFLSIHFYCLIFLFKRFVFRIAILFLGQRPCTLSPKAIKDLSVPLHTHRRK